ncbi:hypothetical protein GpartN1_g3169.t1 [Galdieria partita]|uniref:Uncharacterized protein n=1 Tax=Galdieria partita TaxID=83374 RepID=A0A9C7UPZ2_9RHOD|nr:hypothetical protein GpartN1_g3169.t1 [Galdieria partita]
MSTTEKAAERRRRILNSSSQRLKVASGSSHFNEDNNIHSVERETFPRTSLEDKENLFELSTSKKAIQQDAKDPLPGKSTLSWELNKFPTQSSSLAVSHTSRGQNALDRFSIIRRVSHAVGTLSSSRVDNLFRHVSFIFMGVLFAVTLCATTNVSKVQLDSGTMWLTPLKSVSFFTWFIAVELAVNTTKIMSSFSEARNSRLQQLLAFWKFSQLLYWDLLCGLFGFLGYFRWFRCITV